ncbi:MAG: TIM barrel protein, partial [Acidobacteria bacterium]|nr:TIM barrel protein [Acidobacteriota bacterium]
MSITQTRREFSKTVLGATAGAASLLSSPLKLLAAKKRNIKIGHTSITWPMDRGCYAADDSQCPPEQIEAGIKDISSLGFYGYELFGVALQKLESRGGLGQLLNKYNLPLISAYCTVNLIDPAKTKEGPQSIPALLENAKLVKKCGGTVVVLGPNQVDRKSYDFRQHQTDIVNALGQAAKAVTDIGITTCFHPHTGTCVENRDEIYAVMNAVDTRYVKFGPDIGQLQKGGSDPLPIVKDFLPLVEHMHF